MWVAEHWDNYRLMDAGDGNRLEQWSDYTVLRPETAALWGWASPPPQNVDLHFVAGQAGGSWKPHRVPERFAVTRKELTFEVGPTRFKHMGIFPEQAANWDWMTAQIQSASGTPPFADRSPSVLNLFGYTGGATIALAKAGAVVTHVDASKKMVDWARRNADRNGCEARWIVDDCAAFVAREIRRGKQYDGILLDPPSFGRGPRGEVWKLEDTICAFLAETAKLLSPNALFFLLNTYTPGFTPGLSETLLRRIFPAATIEIGELALRSKTGLCLPCGVTGRCTVRQQRTTNR